MRLPRYRKKRNGPAEVHEKRMAGRKRQQWDWTVREAEKLGAKNWL